LKLHIAAVAGVSLLGAVAIAVPGSAGGNKYSALEVTRDCGDGDLVTLDGPPKLWPPNHKFVAEPVTADGGTDSEGVSLLVTVDVGDVSGGDGGANHDPDYTPKDVPASTGTGAVTVDLELRAERSGKGLGRTYTVNWKATFDDTTKSCQSGVDGQLPFTVTVPHDMGGGADWKP
jgi:hypothetical protein